MKSAVIAVMGAVALAFPAAAHADVDTEFSDALNVYGIYGQKDYNAWLGKIACKRIDRGVDGDASASLRFIDINLGRNMTPEQDAQFLGLAINAYCPAHLPFLQTAPQPGAAERP